MLFFFVVSKRSFCRSVNCQLHIFWFPWFVSPQIAYAGPSGAWVEIWPSDCNLNYHSPYCSRFSIRLKCCFLSLPDFGDQTGHHGVVHRRFDIIYSLFFFVDYSFSLWGQDSPTFLSTPLRFRFVIGSVNLLATYRTFSSYTMKMLDLARDFKFLPQLIVFDLG